MDNALIKIEQANRLLAECKTIQEAKQIIDVAKAAEIYAKRAKLSQDTIKKATDLKLTAERLLGQMLQNTERAKGAAEKRCTPEEHRQPTLKELNITRKESSQAQMLADLPEEKFEDLKTGKKTITKVQRELRTAKREKIKTEIPKGLPEITDRYKLYIEDIKNDVNCIEDNSINCVITDPPYPKEYLELYDFLGKFSKRVLKEGGSLICMSGQSYLPEVLNYLNKYLTYNWMCAYLMSGDKVKQWQRKVLTGWKPLLWYVKGEYNNSHIFDVFESDKKDKNYHRWGQSVIGMKKIIDSFTNPGDLICDPFCGGGATGVAVIEMNRLFIGIDNDKEAINITKKRLYDTKRE